MTECHTLNIQVNRPDLLTLNAYNLRLQHVKHLLTKIRAYIIRATRVWNTLPKDLTINDITLKEFII